MKTSSLNPAIAATLAIVTLLSAGLALSELGRDAVTDKAGPLRFDVAEDAIASALVEAAKSDADYQRAARHAEAAVKQSAYNNNARLRLAFIDTKTHGDRLTSDGERRFAQSYDLVPYDPTVAAWRIRFALEHWQSLRPSTRRDVQREALALGIGTAVSSQVQAELKAVANPTGRVPARLWLMVLKLRRERDEPAPH